MKILIQQPPNIEAIRKVFPNLSRVIFAYDGDIYNPDSARVDGPMIAHEEVHFEQQKAIGVEVWWDAYLRYPKFRLIQEIPAYRRQYEVARSIIKDDDKHFEYGKALAKSLASATYGNCVSLTEAINLITT